ncbi:MAG: hypothetical protein V1724_06330 [Chloroflexota bacterium]
MKYAAAQSMKDDVMALVLEQGRPYQPFAQAHVTIRWEAKDRRRRDLDNLLASMKPALDGLVAAGVLEDDSAQALSVSLEYAEGCAENATIMTVQEDA